MTRERIRAHQASQPPKGVQMVRATITATTPLTVELPGGGTVPGLPLPGATYTIGGAALVLAQEPAIGPVYPLPGTTTVPGAALTASSGTLTYSGTVTDWASDPTVLTRIGPLVSLKLQAIVGASIPSTGAVLATLPAGFRPAGGNVWVRAILYTGGWGNGCDLELRADNGNIVLRGATVAISSGNGIFLSTTYTAA